jgi:hypothetical protein
MHSAWRVRQVIDAVLGELPESVLKFDADVVMEATRKALKKGARV